MTAAVGGESAGIAAVGGESAGIAAVGGESAGTAAVGGESAGIAAGLTSRPAVAGLQIRASTAELHWRPSTLALAVATCVATALAVAVIAGQWQVIVFAAPLVGLLGGVAWMVSPARSVQIIGDPDVLRCFESEPVTVGVTASPIGGPAELRMTLEPADGLALAGDGPPRAGAASRSVAAEYRISAKRWGRYDLSGTVVAAALGGMLTARATVPFAELRSIHWPPRNRRPSRVANFPTASARI